MIGTVGVDGTQGVVVTAARRRSLRQAIAILDRAIEGWGRCGGSPFGSMNISRRGRKGGTLLLLVFLRFEEESHRGGREGGNLTIES